MSETRIREPEQVRRYVPCRCWSADHLVAIDPDEDDAETLYVSVVSTRNGSFWHRVRWSLKHIFGGQDLVFADIVVNRSTFAAAIPPLPQPPEPRP